jgi:hypothetical protein
MTQLNWHGIKAQAPTADGDRADGQSAKPTLEFHQVVLAPFAGLPALG